MKTAPVHVADWTATADENGVPLTSLLLANGIDPSSSYEPPSVGQMVNVPDPSPYPMSVAGGGNNQIEAGPPGFRAVKIRLYDSAGNLMPDAKVTVSYRGDPNLQINTETKDGWLTVTYLPNDLGSTIESSLGDVTVQWGLHSTTEHQVTVPLLPPFQAPPSTQSSGDDEPVDVFKGALVSEVIISLVRGKVGFLTPIGTILGTVDTDLAAGSYTLKPDLAHKQWIVTGPGVKAGLRFSVDLDGADPWTLSYPDSFPLLVAPGMPDDPKNLTWADMHDDTGALKDPLWLYEGFVNPVTGPDDFETAGYDLHYRAEGENFSKFLVVDYRDGTHKDINIDDINSPTDTPRLWAHKQDALKQMDDATLMYMLHVFPSIFVQIMTDGMMMRPALPNMGPRFTVGQRPLPRTLIDMRPPTRSFFSVQNEVDAARLARGGAPWPQGENRALLGEGFYSFSTREEAEAYLALRSRRGLSGLSIIEGRIGVRDYNALNTLDLRTLSDAEQDTWMQTYSLWGKAEPHGFTHMMRRTGTSGVEYYFSKDVVYLFKF